MSQSQDESDPLALAGRPAPDSMAYDAAVTELEALIDAIESGEVGLEASVRAYERGAALLRRCRALLTSAEQRVTEIEKLMGDDRSAEGSGTGTGAGRGGGAGEGGIEPRRGR